MLVVRPAVSRFGVGAVVFESRVTVSEQCFLGSGLGLGSTIRWLSGLRDQVELGFNCSISLSPGCSDAPRMESSLLDSVAGHAVLARTYCCQAQPEPQVAGAVKHNPPTLTRC